MDQNWHHRFNPKNFLQRIRIESLLRKNEVLSEALVSGNALCVLCRGFSETVLVLNDKRVVCKPCFEKLSWIQYPERYEKAWREFRAAKEAHRQARNLLVQKSVSRRIGSAAGTLILISLAAAYFVHWSILGASAICIVAWLAGNAAHNKALAEWDRVYPAPVQPEVRHFHDPQAILSQYDRAVLSVFDHWPGYPPYWDYLREVILARDNNRCQVSGCPSRVSLHIHHMLPTSRGGPHSPENLVTLCDFHHALEPDSGHERIWGNIKTRYFTLVHEHTRINPVNPGSHVVQAHLRRLELVSKDDLSKISSFYGFACPFCHTATISIRVIESERKVVAQCLACEQEIEGPRQVAEETGPLLAERVRITRNQGRWKPRWDTLAERVRGRWGDWTPRRRTPKEQRAAQGSPKCPACGQPMRLIVPSPGQTWKPFWGCASYRTTRCRGSRPYAGNRH